MFNQDGLVQKYFDLSSQNAISQEHPKATIVIGESGAGKEVITTQAQEEFYKSGGSVLVDHDLLHGADPHKSQLDVNETSQTLINEASKNKYNLVVSKDFEDQNDLSALTKDLKEHGYTVEVRAMASPKEVSEHRQNQESLYAEAVLGVKKIESHFLQDHVANQLEHLQLHDEADDLKVYDRVGNEIYQNQKDSHNVWLQNNRAYSAYNFEVNKPLQQSETAYIQLAQHQISELRSSVSGRMNQQLEKLTPEISKQIELDLSKPNFIRDASNYKGVQKGILLDNNDQFMVLKINNAVGIRYDKSMMKQSEQNKDSNLRQGQELYINHADGGQSIMSNQEVNAYEQEQQQQQAIDNHIVMDHGR